LQQEKVRKMATIIKRGPYQWQAKIRKKGHKSLSKTFDYRVDAEQWARDIEVEMDRGVYISRREAETITLREAFDRYIDEHILKNLSHAHREVNRVRVIQERDWGDRFLSTIRAKDVADFIKDRQREGVSGSTIRRDLAQISKLFHHAASNWGMQSLVNPVKYVAKPKENPGRTKRLTPGEEERLLKACSTQFKPIVQFALETAMRRSEIASLRWEHVHLRKRFVHLPATMTRNKEARSIPLSPPAIRILMNLSRNINGSVFGMSADSLTRNMTRVRRNIGLKGFRFHDLRHEAISRFFENTDLDVMEIKTITGHKTLSMLARYSHLRTHRLADRLAGGKRG
jgi:integrase